MTVFKMGELFCGPGGIGLAAKWASVSTDEEVFRIEHAWATDYDRDTCDTYRNNLVPGSPNSVVCRDIRTLDLEHLAAISPIDALSFGFPCNDFSIVGEQRGMDGVYGPLYAYGVATLKRFRPKWFLAENVGGLRNADEGKSFTLVLKELIHSGYKLVPHLYKFELYGVPQRRHRIVIVGIRNDIPVEYKVPSPELYRDTNISSQHAIECPPIPSNATNHEFTRQSEAVVERLKHINPGENAFTADLPEHLRLNVRGAKISQIYKRLSPGAPAYTVTGSGGGGTHVYHWKENRALTNRERARLQTFPDSFTFYGSKESVRKQIGMAVPPKGAEIIFNAILNCFAGINYPSVPANIPFNEIMEL